MGALRSIIKGEQLVSLSVLTKCELFLRQRFPDFHEITFVQKPLKFVGLYRGGETLHPGRGYG